MKFIRLHMIESTKVAEFTKVSDKVWASPPKGIKPQAIYACLGIMFPGQPPNTVVTMTILEAENAESLAVVSYPLTQVGATVWAVPILDVPIGGAAQVERKLKS